MFTFHLLGIAVRNISSREQTEAAELCHVALTKRD